MIVDQEEGENLASMIVEGIVNRGQEVLFEKHIESQVLPYAVQFAKGTLLKIVQWQFFRRDTGEVTSPSWGADEEPQPAIIDSWARGAIPIKRTISTAQSSSCQPKHTITDSQNILAADEYSSAVSSPQQSAFESSETVRGLLALGSSNLKVNSSATSVTSRPSKVVANSLSKISSLNKPTRKAMGSIHSEEPEISAATAAERAIIEENKRVTARIHGLERDGAKAEVGFDPDGRILLVKKAGASKLFTQGVRAKVVTDENPQEGAPTTRASVAVTKRATVAGPQGPRNILPSKPRSELHRMSEATTTASLARSSGVRFGESQATMTSRTTVNFLESTASLASFMPAAGTGGPLNAGGFVPDTTLDIPLLTETMRLAPGVTLREGETIKKGPKPSKKMQDRNKAADLKGSSVTLAGESPRVVKRQIIASVGADPVLSRVLNKAKPSLRPIPFPTLAVRERTPGTENPANAFKKLPDIKAEERRRVETAQ
ncbi:hypothetical protein BDR26DRAFT_887950 [Obelidium mucronatum]|nr:hypothetical protein BDR26DRAFT_887950 [Obelidium mucronatum]